jgi:crotonobetainyl-CoA:carnitine CoA-transferase CaiB-like acyl-CoA transferase
MVPFAGWRVLELSTSIAVSYCGKMFADAGAEVVKVESPQGDPIRYCRHAAADGRETEAGALFGFLAAGKKSVVRGDESEIAELVRGADLVLTDLTDGWSLDKITALAGKDSAVIVVITPFGTTGPYAASGFPVNEFILQAMCGSTWSRGWPGSEPLHAGGRIGEWLGGSFAAVVAAATAQHARRGGGGAVVDFSIYESMVIAMGGLSTMATSVLGADSHIAQRGLELP